MSEAVWKQHFLNMAQGKAIKKKNYYIVNVTPTQQAVEMAKDKVKSIKGHAGKPKRAASVKRPKSKEPKKSVKQDIFS